MATISSGSVTVTIQPGEQYRVIATGEAYVDIGGGSTTSYRLTGPTNERVLGGFTVATPVTIRVISGSVEYLQINKVGALPLTPLQSSNQEIVGSVSSDVYGNIYNSNGKRVGINTRTGVVPQRLFGGQSSSLAGTGRTVAMQIPTDVNFVGVRLILANWQIADTLNIDACKVAVTDVDNSTGAGLTWTTVTFNGSNSIVVPAGTQGTVGGGGATVNKIGKFAVSDIVWIPSVARTDVAGAQRLLHIRTYAAGNVYMETPALFAAGALPYFADRGYVYRYQQQTGDNVTSPTAMTFSTSAFFTTVAGVDFITGQANQLSIYAFGDSLTHGSNAGYQSGWPVMLNYLLRTNGKPGAVCQFGVGGMLHENYIANMKGLVAVDKPAAVIFSGYSPNSASSTQAGMDNQFARTIEAVEWLKRNGVVPIVTTAKPVNTDDSTRVALKLAFNTRLLNELSTYCSVVDLAAVVRDPNDYGKINPAYSLDGTHINDLGLSMEAAKLYDSIYSS